MLGLGSLGLTRLTARQRLLPFIRKIHSLLNVRFRRQLHPNQTTRFRPKLATNRYIPLVALLSDPPSAGGGQAQTNPAPRSHNKNAQTLGLSVRQMSHSHKDDTQAPADFDSALKKVQRLVKLCRQSSLKGLLGTQGRQTAYVDRPHLVSPRQGGAPARGP